MTRIACPVALHPDGSDRRIAICLDPQTGFQLVKTPVQPHEDPTTVAARILFAKSALETRAALPVGTSPDIDRNATWHFALCRVVPPVRDRWQHLSNDTHLLQFSWMPLDAATPAGFDPIDLRALDWIKATL